MADDDPRNPAPAASAPDAPATALAQDAEGAPPPAFDVNGFDPSEFEWRPVPRRPRADGWTPEVQRAFIQALADTGMVEHAARDVDMSVTSCYRLRRAAGAESFARAWDAALAGAAERLLDITFARAIEGDEIPVFDRDGCRIGAKRKSNDRLIMFLLRAYMPDRFGDAREGVRRAAETPAPGAALVADALAALTPVTPAEPHRLMPPDRLENFVDGAHGLAELYEAYPDLDRKPYVPSRVEQDHPAAFARRVARHKRELERDDGRNRGSRSGFGAPSR